MIAKVQKTPDHDCMHGDARYTHYVSVRQWGSDKLIVSDPLYPNCTWYDNTTEVQGYVTLIMKNQTPPDPTKGFYRIAKVRKYVERVWRELWRKMKGYAKI